MESCGLVFEKTRSLCIAILVAIFVTSCESRVDLLQPTTPATVKQPQCLFNDVSYNVGDNWNPFLLPEGYYRCKRCSCKLSSDGSMALINCDRRGCKKPSLHAKPSPNEQQNSCTHQGNQRNHGAVWAVPVGDQNVLGANQCQECSCTDGFVTCALRNCPVLSCKNQTNTDGTCCPVCAGHVKGPQDPMVCETMGRHYNHMETWYPRIPPRYDMCINCTCQNTSIQCTIPDCPKVTCKSPQRKAGDCCETCPVNPNPDECVWGVLRFPHNSTFHPTVKPFGVVNCVRCFCNPANSEIECEHLKCPTSYPCKTPVSVPGKCCKVCEGSDPQIKNGTNGRTCHSGKHWRVYEYIKKPQNNTLEVREQFALEDRDHDMVEIHTLYANMTSKVVKVSNTAKRHFHLVLQNNNEYKYIGKIREVQKNKIKAWEQRACHSTQGCIHTVRKIMNGLRERVKRCDHYRSLPPDSLLQPEP